jgi:hypothetical protein
MFKLIILSAFIFIPALAAAHHSFAMYDTKSTLTHTGKLTRFIVGANHSQFIFDLVDAEGKPLLDDGGKPQVWGVETGPASTVARQGVTTESFPLGTLFTVSLNPLRDGRPFGVMQGGIILCGSTMPAGGCTRETGKVFLEPQGPGR